MWTLDLEKHWLFVATLVPSVRVPSKTVPNLPPPSSLLKFSVMALINHRKNILALTHDLNNTLHHQ